MKYEMPSNRVVVPVYNTDRTFFGGRRKWLAIPTIALLASCATPATKIETVEVKVPVATTPLKAAQVPAVPAPLGPRPQSLSSAADKLLAKVCELEGYALRADPLLRLSAGLPQRDLPPFKECEGR